MLFNALQFVGVLILSFGYIPQIKQIVKTRSMRDFNPLYLGSITVGIGFMELYALYNMLKGEAVMFFVTNTVSLGLSLTMLVMYYVYRGKGNEGNT